MKKFILYLSFIISSLFLLSCKPIEERWHQKLTLQIDTPKGEAVGASVVGITARDSSGTFFDVPGGGALNISTQGEAVVVNLGNDRYLIALLSGSRGFYTQTRYAFNDIYDAYITNESTNERGKFVKWIRAAKKETDPRILPSLAYPTLVTFDDIDDPKTVREVDPADLAAIFGQGYALKQITLQMTEEPLTVGSFDRLPFFEVLKSQTTLSGYTSYNPDYPDSINYKTINEFKRELSK
jgi:hypothetical protein